MKILHCCLAQFYIDNVSYQENILSRMHKLQGHTVAILASTETYVNKTKLGYTAPGFYCTDDGIQVTRVPYVRILPHFIARKLRIYTGILDVIETFQPDIIFVHGCQFLSIREIVLYAKKNPSVKIYVDGHTDFVNSARNWVSKNILHRVIYRYCAKIIEPYAEKFYGTLPVRVEFLRDMYGIPADKIELLVFGADDNRINMDQRGAIRAQIRKKLNIADSDFVIITGGKIDKRKNIHVLMRAVRELNDEVIKLVVFGQPDSQMKEVIEELKQHECIRYVGWIPSEQVCDYYLASDLAFFPGTHSVLWEQAVGVGLPCVFKKWYGIQHVDVGGNCVFLENISVEEIKKVIKQIFNDKDLFGVMKKIAREKGIAKFSYSEIARRAIR